MRQCLIVEAEADECRRLAGLLSDYGFEVNTTDDARAALDECRRWAPDMLLVPQRLGAMDAVAFLKHLRRHPGRRVPIVVLLLGDSQDPVEIGRAIWEGASECLMKPYDAHVLDLKLRQTGIV